MGFSVPGGIFFLLASLPAGGPPGGFGPTVLTGFDATGIDAGDFDGDGRLDLAVAGGSSVAVFLQDPADRDRWTVAPEVKGGSPFSVLAADLDGDGRSDLVACDPGGTAWIARSLGVGAFGTAVPVPEALQPRKAAAADFDGDGAIDLATADHWELKVAVFRGDGHGQVELIGKIEAGGESHDLAVLDADLDGRMDLAVGLADEKGALVLFGKGDGRFESKWFEGNAHLIVAADFDGDGRPDLACLAADHYARFPNSLLRNGGGRTFARSSLDIPSSEVLVGAADLDGDVRPDLIGVDGGMLEYRPGNGDFTFRPPVDIHPTAGSAAEVRDLDGDGRRDLVAPGLASLEISWGRAGPPPLDCGYRWFPGTPVSPLPVAADLDGSGLLDALVAISSSEVTAILDPGRPDRGVPITIRHSVPFYPHDAADLDGDGVPDLAGLSASGWGSAIALLDPTGAVRKEVLLPLTDARPLGLAIGPLGDGPRPELAVSTALPRVAIYAESGGDFAEAASVPTIDYPDGLAAGDIDLDGHPDLLVTGKTIAVHFGEGGREFGEPILLEADPVRCGRPAIADLDGDGLPDFAAIDFNAHGIRLYRMRGGRGFDLAGSLAPSERPWDLHLADVDRDGLADIVLVTQDSGGHFSIAVYPNGPAGFRDPPAMGPLGASTSVIRLADFDGDGAPDVFAAGSNRSVLLFDRWPAAPPAPRFRRGDADGDGAVDISDAIAVLGRLFLGGEPLPCDEAADATDDGAVDLSDPIAVLASLFLGAGPLPPPGPAACGPDPTPDALGCAGSCP